MDVRTFSVPAGFKGPLLMGLAIDDSIMHQLREGWSRNHQVKLVVKNNELSVKVVPQAAGVRGWEHKLTSSTLGGGYRAFTSDGFQGTVATRYTVGPKEMPRKEIDRQLKENRQHRESRPNRLPKEPRKDGPRVSVVRTTPLNREPYRAASDGTTEGKFLALNALGPATKETLAAIMGRGVDELVARHSQVYDPSDNFIANDVFPGVEEAESASRSGSGDSRSGSGDSRSGSGDSRSGSGDSRSSSPAPRYILKDKAYKDLRPWAWPYSDEDRAHILNNIGNALTRLGYLATHPLRKKIGAKDTQPVDSHTNHRALGGGLLVSKKPGRRAATDRAATDSPVLGGPRGATTGTKRKSSMLSPSSSSDEDKKLKKMSPSVPGAPANRHWEQHQNLATKFRNRYREYEELYSSLTRNKASPAKKELVKLYELHNVLTEWKKKLWEYEDGKLNMMNLSKHKKMDTPPVLPRPSPTKRARRIPMNY